MSKLLAILFVLLATPVFAADHYASPTGTDTWANSTNISTPCSITTAFSSAQAGDTVYLRGGTYNITSTLEANYSGTGDADANRIIIKNYTGETPTIAADASTNSLLTAILIDRPYWTLDGLIITAENLPDHDRAVITNGYDSSGNYMVVKNCTVKVISSVGHDNISCIRLQANRSNYAVIKNNHLQGQGLANIATRFNHGVQYLGGDNVGTKITNNNIYDCWAGLRVKHANADSSISSGAEIAYNYIYDCGYGIHGNPVYINIHDNLLVSCNIELGDNGGGAQGNHNTFNHNTIYDDGIVQTNPSEGPITYSNITNNIFMAQVSPALWGSGNTSTHYTTLDYNLYISGSTAIREWGTDYSLSTWISHYGGDAHSLSGTPTFKGGASPSTIADYALTSSSDGYLSGSDGKDLGADVSQVGLTDSQQSTQAKAHAGTAALSVGLTQIN